MTTPEFLAYLRTLDVRVTAEQGKLLCSARPGVLTPELKQQLVARKLEILAVLEMASASDDAGTSIVPIQTRGSRPPFFAVPGHNGDVFCYVRLAKQLGSDQPFYAFQPPGVDGRTAPLEDVRQLAAYFVADLLAFQPRGPYRLGGFCLGGVTAFEMARQLCALGHEVSLLALIATASPMSFRGDQRLLALSRHVVRRSLHHLQTLRDLEYGARGQYVAERLRAALPSRRGDDSLDPRDPRARFRRRVEEATLKAVRSYTPQPYPGGISFFLPNESLRHCDGRPMDWAGFAERGFRVFVGPDHGELGMMLLDPDVEVTASHLRVALDGAPGRALLNVVA
jgi:thioesterase domain-containing protein